jgi:hypothetical protein
MVRRAGDAWSKTVLAKIDRCSTVDEVAAVLLNILGGDLPGASDDVQPHAYVEAVRSMASRVIREEIDDAVRQMLERVVEIDISDEDAASELLLLTGEIFAGRARADIAALLMQILSHPRLYPATVAVAAGQCLLALEYHAEPRQWQELHAATGELAVPTVMLGLVRSGGQHAGDWIVQHPGDPWIERTFLNHLAAFNVLYGAERVGALAQHVAGSLSVGGSEELQESLSRLGIAIESNQAALLRQVAAADDLESAVAEFLDGEDVTASAAEFFRERLARAANPRKAERALGGVLKQVVDAWQVDGREPSQDDIRMLYLIEAFTPPGGFDKAFDVLVRHLELERADEISQATSQAALAVLTKTYRRRPPQALKDQAFTVYLSLLHRLVEDPFNAPVAIRQLVRFGEADFNDPLFGAAVLRTRETVTAVADAALDPRNDTLLTWLLNETLGLESPDSFEAFLEQLKLRETGTLERINGILVPPQSLLVAEDRNVHIFNKWVLTYRTGHWEKYESESR